MNTTETINFSYNWNNKLACNSFTTIRRYNPDRFHVGSLHTVFLKKEKLFVAQVIDHRSIRKDDLNEWICHIDTGYSLDATKEILNKMYKEDHQVFSYVLFQKVVNKINKYHQASLLVMPAYSTP